MAPLCMEMTCQCRRIVGAFEVSEEIARKNYVRCHKIFPRASEIAEVGWDCSQLDTCPGPPGAVSLGSSCPLPGRSAGPVWQTFFFFLRKYGNSDF